jgi:hypothetical protein
MTAGGRGQGKAVANDRRARVVHGHGGGRSGGARVRCEGLAVKTLVRPIEVALRRAGFRVQDTGDLLIVVCRRCDALAWGIAKGPSGERSAIAALNHGHAHQKRRRPRKT